MSLPSTSIKDFGGGWNTSDNDINLSSKYQPISVNADRGLDGSIVGRQGTKLKIDLDDGTTNSVASASRNMATVNSQAYITITHVAHGLSNGNHVTISGLTTDLNGIPFASINRTHGVLVVDADNFKISVRFAATSTGTVAKTFSYVSDTHSVGGNIVHMNYFNRRNIFWTDIGEVGSHDIDGNIYSIWNYAAAEALTSGLDPTRQCDYISSYTFKSTMISCNGYDKDKPLQIDKDFGVEYLIDKATLSNSAVPRADYVLASQGYVVFLRTEYGDSFLEFSAKGTDGTFTREASPTDATEVDLSLVTSSVEPTILGGGILRGKVYACFYDNSMLGTLGNTPSSIHVPDFSDVITEHGLMSHNTIISLGNDLFGCDYAGVYSISLSLQSGAFTPIRLSELIAPDIKKHLSNLSEDTLRKISYAVYNKNLKSYMLFIPIYDEVSMATVNDPLIMYDTLYELDRCVLYLEDHKLFENSYITIAGATDIGDLAAADINGVRRVVRVLDEDNVIIELGGHPSATNITAGGGSSLTITPVNDEMLVYVFEYNKEFKTRRWTLYRGWNFKAGSVSQRGKLFLATDRKIYVMGDYDEPIHADFVDDYDDASWANSTAYTVGHRVKDTTGFVYVCIEDHTSAAAGTFTENREANLDIWEPYTGIAIDGEVETPWSDMQDRGTYKHIKYINLDVKGRASFDIACFSNKIRVDGRTGNLAPYRTMQMTADNHGGYGGTYANQFGAGRRTREIKVWPFDVQAKLLRWRYSWSAKEKIQIVSHTMYYVKGKV